MNAHDLIKQLNLIPHPEGGYYKETFRAEEITLSKQGDERNAATVIYYLLEDEDKSHFHKIKSDELWFHHMGQALKIFYIADCRLNIISLGNDMNSGETPMFKIPADTWFACRLKHPEGFSLVSCLVVPGFDFADFKLADRKKLTEEFPELSNVIEEFTRT